MLSGHNKKSIVFFGSGPVASESLDFLVKHFEIEAVITKAKPLHHCHNAPVEELAKKNNLKVLFANNKFELDQIIDSTKFNSIVGIIIDYGVIVSKKTIDSFEFGIVNSHFSLLPQLRGADPITFSLLSGQTKTGVSLMVIDEGMDTGKLITQAEVSIDICDNQKTLTKKLIEKSNSLLLEFIPKYIDNQIELFDQPNLKQPTYSTKLNKANSHLDFNKTAQELDCEIRAYLDWPGSIMNHGDKIIKIKKAHVSDKPETELDKLCSDGKYIIIDELIAPSGKKMTAKAFLNGCSNSN